jgi:hypothetical protein
MKKVPAEQPLDSFQRRMGPLGSAAVDFEHIDPEASSRLQRNGVPFAPDPFFAHRVAKNREALPQTGSSSFPPQAGKQQLGQSVARMPGAVHGQIGKERKGFLVRQGDCFAVLGDKGRSQE